MKTFDLFKAPLTGTHLIEASAGTGKTYAIESLFVRLVLEKEILPSQILVVTFTQSATDELKERIYRKLVGLRHVFGGRAHDDDFITRYCADYPDHERGGWLVQEAISEFDRAAIFTIHGFCQRILHENAFETGKLFDTELIEDQTPLARQIARDFWRNHLYFECPEVIAFMSNYVEGPEALAGFLQSNANEQVCVLPQVDRSPAIKSLEAFREAALTVKTVWQKDRHAVQATLFDPALSGNIFGGIQPGRGAGGVSQRQVRVAKLVASMDAFCRAELAVPPLFNDFAKFTTGGLARATRKGQETPEHAFFDCCDRLASVASELMIELESYLAWFKGKALEYSRAELTGRKKKLNVQYFDDLLTQVKQALGAAGGDVLIDSVRRRYRAALVDEFQDTDRVQYDIFAQFFAQQSAPLFLIGDPKQAIYGFRGADVFTYMQAARQSRTRHTLVENWRSSSGLIAAVNAIFSSAPVPFAYDEIRFEPGISAGEPQPEAGVPMTIWYLDSRKHGDKGKPVPKYVAEPLIVNALAAEMSSLLNAPEPEVKAGDMAVLVRTNRQARLVKSGLNRFGIPAVLHSTGNIFDTPEAGELEVLLNCIAHPNDGRRMRAALATQLWGKTANELLALDNDSALWQGLMQRITDYHDIWQRDGFMSMFRQLLAREAAGVRLMGMPNGERRLTNLLHLSEILHHSASEMNLNMPALINWLAEQRNSDAQRLDTHQLRMESDDEAVKIVTIHKSKGLEYPVVFCPFSWEDSRSRGNELQYHDPRNGYRPTLNLNVRPDDECRKWAQNEQLAENLRLLYVALTRARKKCYLVWGRIRSAETSALAYLLHARIRLDEKIERTDLVGLLASSMADRSDEDYLTDLKDLAGGCRRGCLSITPLPQSPPSSVPTGASRTQLSRRKFEGTIDRTHSIISYSTLVARRAADADLPDHDDLLGGWQAMLSGDPVVPKRTEESDIFAFAKGAQTGVFFHDLLEQMTFNPDDRKARADLVKSKLEAHGFESWWQTEVTELLQQVLELEMPAIGTQFHFGRLTSQQRVHELEFYFPLKQLTPDHLVRLLEPHFSRPDKIAALDRIKTLAFSPARGFAKGFIDMVFVHNGRYYLVDWKSNHLGNTKEDYHYNRLKASMDEHLYGLQSLIYTLALDRYLHARLPDYRYETHFGGTCYIFLRGIRIEWGDQYGVFTDRLAPAAIRALREALIG